MCARRHAWRTHAANTAICLSRLYAVEAAIRGKPPDERRRVRQEQARPLLDAVEIWLRSTLGTVSQTGDTAKADNYALNQWAALTLYVDDGAVEIDNNAAERALRAVALGQKDSCTSVPSLIVIRRRHVADQLHRDATDS